MLGWDELGVGWDEGICVYLLSETLKHISAATMPMLPGMIRKRISCASKIGPRSHITISAHMPTSFICTLVQLKHHVLFSSSLPFLFH